MALESVGARTEGDVYQGLFFWSQAASLLNPSSLVARVELEYDVANGVDDVAVFYDAPGVEAGGFQSLADFYQLKYHVDRRTDYSSEALVDPAFLSTSARSSMLARFRSAYSAVKDKYSAFRLHLASNWRWADGDPLARSLREYDGALPRHFFEGGNKSKLGLVREAWRAHLGMDAPEFRAFATTLRFQLDHMGRRGFREAVHDRLAAVGLRVPDAKTAASPYESLTQRFLMDRKASFDRASFRELCEREGLLEKGASEPRSRTIAVRSFLRFAEHLEDEAKKVVSLQDEFEGRWPLDGADSWKRTTRRLRDELSDAALGATLRAEPHDLLLECHGSFALLTGYELSTNSGAVLYPVQKPGRAVWKAGERYEGELWAPPSIAERDPKAVDVALSISVTHETAKDVDAYLDASGLQVLRRLDLRPATGVGPTAIQGGAHAHALAAALVGEIRKCRGTGTVHLFSAAPNGLMFFLGRHREALGGLRVYEFDFGGQRGGSYTPSVVVP